MNTKELGDRIKDMFESRTKILLPRRTYTVIRIDGKGFSKYTRSLNKPFDLDLAHDFDETSKVLCSEIMGCKLAYTQSDEITLILSDFDGPMTDAWFDANLQKMCSVSASIATAAFNRLRSARNVDSRPAYFDSRVFTIPQRDDVVACLMWRQADAIRNSISMVARTVMSHKEMDGIGVARLKDIIVEKGVDLSSFPVGLLQGRMIFKESYTIDVDGQDVVRSRWVAAPAPVFSNTEALSSLIP